MHSMIVRMESILFITSLVILNTAIVSPNVVLGGNDGSTIVA